tara:strand:+ start:11555 stop:11722 length:168 start_codon:yes stop_codon:yes gene_type:complete
MNSYDQESNFGVYDSAPATEPERFQDEYQTFEFEAMAEVPIALAAFILHQHTFDQ